jgi:hypothetical protein
VDKITFETNIARELRLQFLEGKLGESKFGGNQFMFTTDQGPFWVSEPVGNILHDQIRKQQIAVGEPVEICKREVSTGNGRKGIRWEVYKVGFAPGEQPNGTFVVAAPPAAGVVAPAAVQATSQPPIAHNGNGSSNGAGGQGPGAGGNGHAAAVAAPAPAPDRAKTKLEDALKTVISAVHAAQEYAKTIGYAIPQFTSEDLRTMANTLMIQNGGGK